ncbi:acylphosphatase [Methanocalculus sp. MSAO_Arc2]|uniref:acylphosphatase n=1 Tax=Methanocalculus sp. MSAO_Arc2 TaxID=2293855 RepID=UPI002686B154
MKRFVAIAKGRVQGVGYREYVYNETFETDISGYVKNLDTGEVGDRCRRERIRPA